MVDDDDDDDDDNDVCSFYVLYCSSLEMLGRGLSAVSAKLTRLCLQTECPSYHLNVMEKINSNPEVLGTDS